MSEGGRKVWNREQLEALNNGAVIRARVMMPDGPELHPSILEWDSACRGFHGFCSEMHWEIEDAYPIEVIWEPNE